MGAFIVAVREDGREIWGEEDRVCWWVGGRIRGVGIGWWK